MAKTQVQFAILVPKSVADLEQLQGSKDGTTIVQGEMRDASPSDQALSLDLATAGTLGWLVINVVGPIAGTIALNLISNHLWDKYKAYGKQNEEFKLDVRLPSGKRVRFSAKDPAALKELMDEFEVES
ncbi:hypothetical protein RJ527_04180 [Thalassospiraceae bacterium LMO-SO8]|nr:hypothetical protein [Alphaproteobacteria bacterium LMO-S08]WND76949.1 hypothetical protein RJ527_04180 [Thalassospiraceae bacterium LMO-SO8]